MLRLQRSKTSTIFEISSQDHNVITETAFFCCLSAGDLRIFQGGECSENESKVDCSTNSNQEDDLNVGMCHLVQCSENIFPRWVKWGLAPRWLGNKSCKVPRNGE